LPKQRETPDASSSAGRSRVFEAGPWFVRRPGRRRSAGRSGFYCLCGETPAEQAGPDSLIAVGAILDTDILSEYLKDHNAAVAGRAAGDAKDHSVFTLTSATVYEIVYGLELKGAATQLKRVMDWLKQNEEITPIDADYLAAATIKATARKPGSVVELPDCLIASIACGWVGRS